MIITKAKLTEVSFTKDGFAPGFEVKSFIDETNNKVKSMYDEVIEKVKEQCIGRKPLPEEEARFKIINNTFCFDNRIVGYLQQKFNDNTNEATNTFKIIVEFLPIGQL